MANTRIDVIEAGLPRYSMETCREMLEDNREGTLRLFLISQGQEVCVQRDSYGPRKPKTQSTSESRRTLAIQDEVTIG